MKYLYEVIDLFINCNKSLKVSNISLLLWDIIDLFFVYKITPGIRGPPLINLNLKKLVRRRKYE